MVKKNRVQLGVLGSGSYFGEISLLTNEPRSANVRATLFCELEMIRKEDFNAIIQSFPQFHIALKRIADSRKQTAKNMQNMSKLMKNDAPPSSTEGRMTLGVLMSTLRFISRKKSAKVNDADATKRKGNMLFDSVLDDDFILNMSQAKARNITSMKRINPNIFDGKHDVKM